MTGIRMLKVLQNGRNITFALAFQLKKCLYSSVLLTSECFCEQ